MTHPTPDTPPAPAEWAGANERVLLPVADAATTRRAAWRLLRPRRGLATLAALTLVASAAVGLAGPLAIGYLVDVVVDGRGADAVTAPVVVLVLVAVAQSVLGAAGEVLVSRVGEPALADLRERVVERTLHLPPGQVEQAGSGDLLARVSGDVEVIATAVRSVVPTMATSALTIGLTVVGLAALDWRFALAGLCAVPIQAHTLRWYLRDSTPVYAAERVAEGARAQQLLDSIGGADTVRALRLGGTHVRLVARRSMEAADLAYRATRLQTRFYGRLNIAELVGLGTILATGFVLVRDDAATIGATTAAALFFSRLFDPINALLALVDVAQEAGAGLARLVGVAELAPPTEPAHPARPSDSSLQVAAVHYAYEAGHEVLHGVDVDAAAGERVAIVGASGAGKTTVAKLVAGILHATSGRVALGGASVDALGPAGVRRAVALVSQEVHVFAGTLADDLRLARPDATDNDIHAALELVGARPWVHALPDGLATVVGDGGHRLTPTQGQQVALARLALVDPPIAVLDEATAEAGSAGARALEAAAGRVLEGRTALVVAHRLTQAATADRVVVLDGGRVVEAGRHDELVAAGGRYAELWAAWAMTRNSATTGPDEPAG